MKIDINLKNIGDFEFIKKFKINRDYIEQIKRYSQSGKSTSYLISGYRGVGKTTLVRQVEKTLVNEDKEDLTYFAQHFSITELDIDTKSEAEIASLSAYLGPFRKIKTLFHMYFSKYFESD